MNVDTAGDDFLDEVDFLDSTNTGLFFNIVSDLDLQCVAADGTVRNFVTRTENVGGSVSSDGNVGDGNFSNGNFITFVEVGTSEQAEIPDEVTSFVCITDFSGDGSDEVPPEVFGYLRTIAVLAFCFCCQSLTSKAKRIRSHSALPVIAITLRWASCPLRTLAELALDTVSQTTIPTRSKILSQQNWSLEFVLSKNKSTSLKIPSATYVITATSIRSARLC